MSSASGNFGNATTPRPVADAWCVFELDSGNTPIIIDGHGVSGVSRVQSGVFRVAFNNPQQFASGAYVALIGNELGINSTGYGLAQVHGSTADGGLTAGGASASCDICLIGCNPGSSAAPNFLTETANSFKPRINAAFFCLRADADLYKRYVRNLFFNSGNFKSTWSATVPSSFAETSIVSSPVPGVSVFYFDGVAAGSNYINQTAGAVNTLLTYSVYARADSGLTANLLCGGVGNNFGYSYNLQTGTLTPSGSVPSGGSRSGSIADAGDGWKRCILTFSTPNAPSPLVQNNMGADKRFYFAAAQLQEGSVATEYIPTYSTAPVYGNQDQLLDYYPGTDGFGVGSRQNLFRYSQTFTNAYWAKTRMGVSAGGYTAPDGTTTAMKLFELDPSDPASSPLNGKYYKSMSITTNAIFGSGSGRTAGRNLTVSVFAKAAERQHLVFADSNSGVFGRLVVDLNTGLVTENSNSLGVRTIPYGNGWWRVATTVRSILEPTNNYNSLGFGTAAGATVEGVYGSEYPGVSGSGILLWGAQCEQGTVFGDYTPTGATVVGTTYGRLAGNTYPSLLPALGNRGEATAWGTIVCPAAVGTVNPPVAYLENSYGVSRVSASSNSRFEVFFTKPMHTDQYCVVTATEQEPVHIPEATSGANSIPPTEEFTMNMIQDRNATAEAKTVNRFVVTQLRQASTNAFTPQSVHYQRGRTTRIHFMVFGGRQLYGTP